MKQPIFCGMAWRRSSLGGPGFWFRVGGYGLHVKSAKGHRPLFSERNGYSRPVYLLGLRIEWLKPRH